jgi:hypothetical protein
MQRGFGRRVHAAQHRRALRLGTNTFGRGPAADRASRKRPAPVRPLGGGRSILGAMSELVQWFQEGGWAMYGALCCSLLSVAIGLGAVGVAFATKKRSLAIGLGAATLLFALTTLCTGVGGYLMGMRTVEGAVAFADPAYRTALLEQGRDEAQNNLEMGACASLLPLLLGLTALARGLTLPRADGHAPRG